MNMWESHDLQPIQISFTVSNSVTSIPILSFLSERFELPKQDQAFLYNCHPPRVLESRLVTLIKTKPIGFWVLEKTQALRDRAMEEEAPGIMVLPTAGISYGTSFFPLLISSSSLCSPIASSPHRSDEGFTRSLALVTVQFLTWWWCATTMPVIGSNRRWFAEGERNTHSTTLTGSSGLWTCVSHVTCFLPI